MQNIKQLVSNDTDFNYNIKKKFETEESSRFKKKIKFFFNL